MGLIDGSRILKACLFLAVLQAQKLQTSSRICAAHRAIATGAGPLIPIPVKCFQLASRVLQSCGSVCIRGIHGNEEWVEVRTVIWRRALVHDQQCLALCATKLLLRLVRPHSAVFGFV